MTKAELRRQFLRKRKALTANEVNQGSQRIAAHFFNFLKENNLADAPATIHTFLPIQRQNEVDTWPIIRCIWEKYKHLNIVVPVTNDSDNTLHHYPLFPQIELIDNRWGIPEPVITHQKPQSPTDLGLVLVPLLAFDQQGQRIGYGGGFYDRFLADCRPNCLKVGLSFFDPVKEIDDVEPTDIRLDACITPVQVRLFSE